MPLTMAVGALEKNILRGADDTTTTSMSDLRAMRAAAEQRGRELTPAPLTLRNASRVHKSRRGTYGTAAVCA
jgi:hypothetical protein